MELTTEQKLRISFLLLAGKTDAAARYLEQALNISNEDAVRVLIELRKLNEQPVTEQQQTTIMRNSRKVIIIMAAIGIVLFGVAAYLIAADYQFSHHALHVEGEVIEYHDYEVYSEEDGTSTNYSPVFRYEVNGKYYTQRGRGSSSTHYALGEKVDIMIDPANPEIVLVDTFRERWFVQATLIIGGIIFTGFAYLMKRFGKPPEVSA